MNGVCWNPCAKQGRDVRHLQIGASFPDPTPEDMADRDRAALTALEPARAVILDGFMSATIDTDALARLHVPTVAMVHHPLALESGLEPARAIFSTGSSGTTWRSSRMCWCPARIPRHP
jgi:hypothetical protein